MAASLKRHVYIQRGSWRLHPNLFTFLIGVPAIGKGAAIDPGIQMLKRAGTANILSDRITMEWIKETLAKGFTPPPRPGPGGIVFGHDASCLLVAPELSVFLRHPEEELPDLADLWDAREGDQMYGTRGKGLCLVKDPCPTMLAACAPGWLKDSIPQSAAGGGFTRRVNFIFSNTVKYDNVWPSTVDWNTVTKDLVSDLIEISKIRGEYKFDNLARPLFEAVYKEQITDFSDEATTHYVAARWANTTKVAMCIAASRKDDLVITKEEFEEAEQYTAAVRDSIKTVFRSVGSSDMVGAADKILRFIENSGTCTINQLMAAVWRECSRQELDVILVTLRDAGLIDESLINNRTVLKCRVPINPQPVSRPKKFGLI